MSLLAYIDPGTGALVIQVLAAAFLTVGVFGRRMLLAPVNVVKSMFRSSK